MKLTQFKTVISMTDINLRELARRSGVSYRAIMYWLSDTGPNPSQQKLNDVSAELKKMIEEQYESYKAARIKVKNWG